MYGFVRTFFFFGESLLSVPKINKKEPLYRFLNWLYTSRNVSIYVLMIASSQTMKHD